METNRFAELLNPIRDLARNWDVDIAHCLEDYLEELGDTELGRERCSENNSITPHRQSLNFAEAALLIQGSAAVYSKKVEYVYALVYQALQHITSANKKDEKVQRWA
jgi:condensin-2 complex subunit H2